MCFVKKKISCTIQSMQSMHKYMYVFMHNGVGVKDWQLEGKNTESGSEAGSWMPEKGKEKQEWVFFWHFPSFIDTTVDSFRKGKRESERGRHTELAGGRIRTRGRLGYDSALLYGVSFWRKGAGGFVCMKRYFLLALGPCLRVVLLAPCHFIFPSTSLVI